MREIPESRPGDTIPQVSIAGYFALGALVTFLISLCGYLLGSKR